MSARNAVTWIWRVLLCGLVHAAGSAIGWAVTRLVLEMPRNPVELDPLIGWSLLIPGGIVLASGLAFMAGGVDGRPMERALVFSIFAFGVNGISIALETSIFTTLGGNLGMAISTLPASVLCGFAVARLFPAVTSEPSPGDGLKRFVARWSPGPLLGRLAVAIVAFPVIYALFGMLVSPFVIPYYGRLEFLVIPPSLTIFSMQILRSALFLAVSIPIATVWRGSRLQLGLALGWGHFTAVGLSGLIQTPLFPAPLALAHSLEVFGDSFVYAFVLAWLFHPDSDAAATEKKARKVEGFRQLEAILRGLAAVMCFVAIGSWPHIYYQVVKWVVCISAVAAVGAAARNKRLAWSLALGLVAVVFNPILPMPLSQTLWVIADAIAGLVLVGSLVAGRDRTLPARDSEPAVSSEA